MAGQLDVSSIKTVKQTVNGFLEKRTPLKTYIDKICLRSKTDCKDIILEERSFGP